MMKDENIRNIDAARTPLPRRSLLGLRLWLVTIGHRTRQQTTAAAHRDSLLKAQRMMARLYAGRWHVRWRMRMLQHMTGNGSQWHMGRSARSHDVRSMGGWSIQLGEIDVGRFQLQGRRLVRRRWQPATLTSPRDQHRVAMLMWMVTMMMMRTTTAYRAWAPRTLFQTRCAVMATAFDPVNRTRRSGRTRRGAPWTWWTRSLKFPGLHCTRGTIVAAGLFWHTTQGLLDK